MDSLYFCESTLFPHEYVNSITSLAMTLVASFALYNNQTHDSLAMTLFYTSLWFNGIGSFILHYTHTYIGHLLDTTTLAFVATFSLIAILEPYTQTFIRRYWLGGIIVGYLLAVHTVISLAYIQAFDYMFAGYMIGILGYNRWLYYVVGNREKTPHEVYALSNISFCLLSVGSVSWCLVELLCHTNVVFSYIPAHGIWHICISIGAYYMSLVILYHRMSTTTDCSRVYFEKRLGLYYLVVEDALEGLYRVI